MATTVVELTGEEADLLRSIDRVVKKNLEMERRLADIGKTGDAAGTEVANAMATIEKESNKALKGFLAELKTLGPEGAAAADALKHHFVDAGKAGYRSVEDILAKVREYDPVAAEAASAGAREFIQAGQVIENQYEKVLDEIRKTGPEGKKAAEEIRKSFVQSGKIAEQSIEGIVDEFGKIDAESAATAKAIIANMKQGTNESASFFTKFGTKAVGELTAVVAGYLGVQQAIEAVNAVIAHQQELVENSRKAHLDLAQSQQEAFKNLVGFTPEEQKKLLLEFAPSIQQETGFPQLKAINDAIGAAGSSGGTMQTIPDTVREAAKLTKLKPEDLDTFSQASLAIGELTKLNAKQNLNILLTAGGVALVKDPRSVAENLPKAMSGVVKSSEADPAIAGVQGAALYGVATSFGHDVEGRSSATAAINLATFVRSLTQGRADDPGDFIGRLKLIQSDDELKAKYKEKLSTEAQFKVPFEKLINPASDEFKSLTGFVDSIKAGTAEFDKTVKNIEKGTPSTVQAVAQAQSDANMQRMQLAQTDPLGQVRALVSGAKKNAPLPNSLDWLLTPDYSGSGGLEGSTASEEAVAGVKDLLDRAARIKVGAPEATAKRQTALLKNEIDNLIRLIQNSGDNLDQQGVKSALNQLRRQRRDIPGLQPGGEGRTDTKDFLDVYARMEQALLDIAKSNKDIAKASEATKENTNPKPPPSRTEELSRQSP